MSDQRKVHRQMSYATVAPGDNECHALLSDQEHCVTHDKWWPANDEHCQGWPVLPSPADDAAEPPTPREEFEAKFGAILDEDWHWLKEFTRAHASPAPIPITGIDVERACEVMHEAYETAATLVGWETQERSRVPWADVPEKNKTTMRAAVRALLAHIESETP